MFGGVVAAGAAGGSARVAGLSATPSENNKAPAKTARRGNEHTRVERFIFFGVWQKFESDALYPIWQTATGTYYCK